MHPLAAASPTPADGTLLVALGAVPGAWLRFYVVNHLEPLLPRRHWGTLAVNSGACFTLGLLMGLQPHCGAGGERLMLLLATGFLGSFSTFSSFMAELHASQRRDPALEPWLLLGGSLLLGLLLTAAGLALGSGA
jgi:CrcB protein